MTAPLRRSTTIDGSAGGEPLSCGNQSTYNRVANAGNLYRLSPFQMPFGILHNLTGEISLTFPLEKSHFITAIHTVHLDHLEMKRMLTDPPRQPLLTRKKSTPRERKGSLTHTAHLWDDTFHAVPRVMKRWFRFFNLLEERFSCCWPRC